MPEQGSGGAPVARDGQGLTKAERVRKRREFLAIQRTGRRYYSRLFILISAPGRTPWTRLGITVSRKLGKAVRRNRLKRMLREAFRRKKEILPPATDIVIIASNAMVDASLEEIASELEAWALQADRRRGRR